MLYLDTARLGQMSDEARSASVDFVRFANEQGCTPYYSRLLKDGFSCWPGFLQRQYSGLSNWEGVRNLEHRFRNLTNSQPDSEVLFASRSASLMKIAAKLISGPCRNVLTTDSCWPAYRNALFNELSRTGNRLTEISIRDLCLRESISSRSLIDFMVHEFVSRKCDGLFLPLVDNLGVHLPMEDLVQEIRKKADLRFVAIDAAQAIGHVPLQIDSKHYDFMLAGTHKWLRAFYTMGVGLFGNSSTRDYVKDSIQRWMTGGVVDDPLMTFCDELTGKSHSIYGETVQVAPMLIGDAAISLPPIPETELVPIRKENWKIVSEVARISGWRLLEPCDEMKSQIVIAEQEGTASKQSAAAIDDFLFKNGVSATIYPDGMLRLSLPSTKLRVTDRRQLINALSETGRRKIGSIKVQDETLLGHPFCANDI